MISQREFLLRELLPQGANAEFTIEGLDLPICPAKCRAKDRANANHVKLLNTREFFPRKVTNPVGVTTTFTLHTPSSMPSIQRNKAVLNQVANLIDLRMQFAIHRPRPTKNLENQAAQLYDLEAKGLLTTWSSLPHHPVFFGRLAPHRAPNGVDPEASSNEERTNAIRAIASQIEEYQCPSRALRP